MPAAMTQPASCPFCEAVLALEPQRCCECDSRLAVIDGALSIDTSPVLDMSPRGRAIRAYSTGPMTPAKQARIDWVRKNGKPHSPGWTGLGRVQDMTDVQILAAFATADCIKSEAKFMRDNEQ